MARTIFNDKRIRKAFEYADVEHSYEEFNTSMFTDYMNNDLSLLMYCAIVATQYGQDGLKRLLKLKESKVRKQIREQASKNVREWYVSNDDAVTWAYREICEGGM